MILTYLSDVDSVLSVPSTVLMSPAVTTHVTLGFVGRTVPAVAVATVTISAILYSSVSTTRMFGIIVCWLNISFLLVTRSLRWRHNDHAGVSNHQPHGCLLNRLFRRKSKKTSKLRVTGLCVGNSPGTGEFPAQMASYAENVSIWWRHHVLALFAAVYRSMMGWLLI